MKRIVFALILSMSFISSNYTMEAIRNYVQGPKQYREARKWAYPQIFAKEVPNSGSIFVNQQENYSVKVNYSVRVLGMLMARNCSINNSQFGLVQNPTATNPTATAWQIDLAAAGYRYTTFSPLFKGLCATTVAALIGAFGGYGYWQYQYGALGDWFSQSK